MADTPVEFGAPKAEPHPDGRLDASSFHRNSEPVKNIIDRHLPENVGHVLEVASGTGQHICNWARLRPDCTFWPTDLAPFHLKSVDAWRETFGLNNIQPAAHLDITEPDWHQPDKSLYPAFDAIIGMNILHIAPWAVSEGLFSGAARHLKQGGLLMIYGPFKLNGQHSSESNERFDQNLRQDDPSWGVRDRLDLDKLAENEGLIPQTPEIMPANNLTLIYQKP